MTAAGRDASTLSSPVATSERWPDVLGFLVAGYAALLPYQVSVTHDLNFALADCCLILIPLLAPGQLKCRSHAWGIWHMALVLVFAAGTLISALNTGTLSRYALLNKDAGLILLLLSYAAITSAVSEWDDVRRILRVFTVGVVAQNVVAVGAFLAAYFFGIETPLTSYGGVRLSGMMLDANAYGGLLVLALVICEGASWGPEPMFSRLSLLFCRISLGMGILFTFSRSTWVSLALAFLVLCVVRRGMAIRFALAGVIGVSFLLLFMGQRFLDFFECMAARPEQGDSRFVLMRDALAQFARHPILGDGLGSFFYAEGVVVHNTALWFLADFGILGLIVLIGYLGSFFTMGWFAYRYAPPREKPLMLALLLAHTAMLGLAMGIEAFYQRHWWLVVALIGAGYSLARQQVGSRRTSRLNFPGDHQ